MKKVYYCPWSDINDLGNLNVPLEKNSNSVIKKTAIGYCPAWNHQNSRTYTYYSSVHMHFQFDLKTEKLFSSTINQNDLNKLVQAFNPPNENVPLVYEIDGPFSNFYWTEEKNLWISVLPHPLTALNNNFYHCGAQFNLSNWSRVVNIGAIVVDPNKPIIINRGDPLYTIKFHTEDQNEEIELIEAEPNQREYIKSAQKVRFVRSAWGTGFDCNKTLFESNPESKSKCPFSFLWNKK